MKKQLQEKEEEMNKKINDIVTKERKNLVARQKMEIDNMRKQNQKELEVNYDHKSNILIKFILDNS